MGLSRDKQEFCYLMAKHSDATFADCLRLMRLAGTHHRIAEHHCNGDCPYTHDPDAAGRETEDLCRKQQRIETDISMIVHAIGALVHFSGDPRGATVKLKVPDGYTNDFGGEGICVPSGSR